MNAPREPGTPTFEQTYLAATGHPPPEHYARAAAHGLPEAMQVPDGSGKTGLILAWLWRRLHGPAPVRAGTPRRLIWALPPGSLLEPAAAEVRCWLIQLELTEEVALHVVTGARADGTGDWRENMHLPAIVVGTTDTLLSKALNRGYGLSRTMFPVDFALTTCGAHWIIDETRLCPQSATTLRQLAGFAERTGTAEPFGLTLLSATPPPAAFRRLAAEPGDYRAIAASALDRHVPGTLTLIVLNTVDAAQQVYRQLRGGPAGVTLLHSRFRGIERSGWPQAVFGQAGDRIVVATPVVEAGIADLGAELLITEAASWASLVLRARHRDRAGGPGEVLWVPPPDPVPGQAGGHQRAVIGPGELATLFDTYPSDDDIDIAPYVRDAEDLDAEVAWATWTVGQDGAPDPEVRHPAPEYRCRVPIGDAVALAEDRAVWRFDSVADRWTALTRLPASRPRPGDLLLVNAADGGYDPETGFDPSARGPVADSPELLTPEELAERSAAEAAELAAKQAESQLADVVAGTEDAYAADTASVAPRRWQPLDEHSEQVRDQAAALLAALAPGIPPEAAAAAVVAGYLHDAGKAHPIWQDALCALADDGERDRIAAGRPWAKSGATAKAGRLEFAGGPGFRHELASLMLLDGPLRRLLAASPDPDLTRYLVLAHHGRLRVQVKDPGELNHEAPGRKILGLEQGTTSDIPPVLGQPAATLTVDLDQFHFGGDRSWTTTVLGLRDKYGPYVLAYLETLVRVADWRASGGRELPA